MLQFILIYSIYMFIYIKGIKLWNKEKRKWILNKNECSIIFYYLYIYLFIYLFIYLIIYLFIFYYLFIYLFIFYYLYSCLFNVIIFYSFCISIFYITIYININ